MAHKKIKPWSKLQKQIYNLITKEITFQMHCTVYSFTDKHHTYESPRHWITLDKEIIWDFPSNFLKWNHPEVPKPISYMEEMYWEKESAVSTLLRQYIDTPKGELLTRKFENDYWGLIDILRVADRRIGKKQLIKMKNKVTNNDAAMKVLSKRLIKDNRTDTKNF